MDVVRLRKYLRVEASRRLWNLFYFFITSAFRSEGKLLANQLLCLTSDTWWTLEQGLFFVKAVCRHRYQTSHRS